MRLILKIAAGIFLGSVLVAGTYFIFITFLINEVTEASNSIVERHQQKNQERILAKRKADAIAAEKVRLSLEKDRKEMELAQKKEQAWYEWYKEPEGCDKWDSNTEMVECTNHKMRAKSEFNDLWETNQL